MLEKAAIFPMPILKNIISLSNCRGFHLSPPLFFFYCLSSFPPPFKFLWEAAAIEILAQVSLGRTAQSREGAAGGALPQFSDQLMNHCSAELLS